MTSKRNRLAVNKIEDLVIIKDNKISLREFKDKNPEKVKRIEGFTFKVSIESNGIGTEDKVEHAFLCNSDGEDDDDDDDSHTINEDEN